MSKHDIEIQYRDDALIVGLGRATSPAVEQRLAADGYRVTVLSEDHDGDILAALEAAADEARPAVVVFLCALPDPAGPADLAVATMIDALDRALVTAGLVAKALFTKSPPPRPSRVVMVLDWAVTSTPSRTAASAVSGGLLGLARSWSLEFAPLGVTANAVVAGPDAGDDPVHEPGDESWLVRRPTPGDVAHAVSFFADPRSAAITGQVLMVCGGRTAGRLTI
ncbi:NAD(P)-dependent dehydrogenase (short-subunit alcohol dehydrogenase family) [Stella humosa]|uniref:NAD(P)-dependent dehydrogenase (Short-subunit alcohol dehydrogenase family) n=1 Tax=Stella humosa TaxID=94 RepID=A0A3N1ME01_9PROT|nr:SDR family oxidoreductase [Stella humosa]ROQ01953.1 NAD(P)-dependent dehydrogenase (short-subunit alcohol dehydrogenase family) [Stella humosa]